MSTPAATQLHLLSPRDPGAKGDSGRWILHLSWPGGGQHVPLLGPRTDETDKAMAQAAAELGYSPEWHMVESKFPGWPPTWKANPIDSRLSGKRTRKPRPRK
jgi:hypothetical protein